MRHAFCCILAAIAVVCCVGGARAQVVTTAYSFETGTAQMPDGFFGLGATVAQDTIGATDLTHSLRYDVPAATGFAGARTETVIPPALNDPPGVVAVLFDMTLTSAYTGTFADIGVTVFGHALNAPGGPQFGQTVQFANTVSIAALGVGPHPNLRINLDSSAGPYRPGESFNAIFGPGPNDLTVASAFQFFISKNTTAPVTVFIDNVRLVAPVPEPGTWCLSALGGVGLGAFARRRRAGCGQG
jgi:PEP-CTERM motif